MKKLLKLLFVMAAVVAIAVPGMAASMDNFGIPILPPPVSMKNSEKLRSAVDLNLCLADFTAAQSYYNRFYSPMQGQSLAFRAAFREQVKSLGVDLQSSGGTIETGKNTIYGQGPNVYRINFYSAVPGIDLYKLSANECRFVVSDGVNKITYITDKGDVRVIDAELPSMTAKTNSTGISAGHGVEFSKNELIRGLNVMAEIINTQSTNAINCGTNRSFVDMTKMIINDDSGMRGVLESAIKKNELGLRCNNGILLMD